MAEPDVTPQQLAVLRAHVSAGTCKGAAHALGIAPDTVRGHLRRVRRRLGVGTTEAAVYILASRGLLSVPDLDAA